MAPYRLMFYNVENLYDADDDPKIDDQEFLPCSEMQWTNERLNTTLQNIAEVILCQIPGVSSITANQIMTHFTGLWDLVDSAKNHPDKFEAIYLETNGKKRKLNKTVIAFLREISL